MIFLALRTAVINGARGLSLPNLVFACPPLLTTSAHCPVLMASVCLVLWFSRWAQCCTQPVIVLLFLTIFSRLPPYAIFYPLIPISLPLRLTLPCGRLVNLMQVAACTGLIFEPRFLLLVYLYRRIGSNTGEASIDVDKLTLHVE